MTNSVAILRITASIISAIHVQWRHIFAVVSADLIILYFVPTHPTTIMAALACEGNEEHEYEEEEKEVDRKTALEMLRLNRWVLEERK